MDSPWRGLCWWRGGLLAVLILTTLAALSACSAVVAEIRQASNFAPPQPSEPEPDVARPADVARLLRQGGVVVYFRHARTDQAQVERERAARENGRFSLDRCETQRNLSDDGRREFTPVGEAFARMGAGGRLTFQAFWASVYCRTRESAMMLTPEPRVFTTMWVEMKDLQNPDRVAKARAFLDEPVPTGQVKVIMAHGGIFWAMTGWSVQEAHAVILVPGQRQRIAARVAPSEWAAIAREVARL